ncbi:MAG: hypothetical protein IKL83_03980 [Muribaculaceae bacterium]|nr:hypothetical protein [Muribaculaceae bacterium]
MEDVLNYSSIEELPTLSAKAAFLVDSSSVFREQNDISPIHIKDNMSYMPWGSDNQMPFDILNLIERDETLSTCQMFNAEVCYGAGLVYNTENCKPEITDEVNDFALMNSIPSYFLGVAQDLKHFAFCVSVIILTADRSKIARLIRKEACYCRFAPANRDGKIDTVYYANWRNNPSADEIEAIDLLDVNAPIYDLMVRLGKAPGADGQTKVRSSAKKFAIITKVPTPDNTYYPIPYYAALFRGKWYNIKRLIALAKESKLKNSAPIKYHIEISADYFDRLCRSEGITDRRQKQERIVAEKQRIIDFLTTAENSGKVWFSQTYTNPAGVTQHDVVINKVDGAKEGGDWESDIQEAINIICFTMRVHSNLVGSVPGKSQTNNSGSDKRELYTIAQALQKPYHDLLFTAHRLIIKFNGWEGAYPDCPFVMLSTLDEGKDAKLVTTA